MVTTMREALERAMGRTPDGETMRQLQEGGLAVLEVGTRPPVDSRPPPTSDSKW